MVEKQEITELSEDDIKKIKWCAENGWRCPTAKEIEQEKKELEQEKKELEEIRKNPSKEMVEAKAWIKKKTPFFTPPAVSPETHDITNPEYTWIGIPELIHDAGLHAPYFLQRFHQQVKRFEDHVLASEQFTFTDDEQKQWDSIVSDAKAVRRCKEEMAVLCRRLVEFLEAYLMLTFEEWISKKIKEEFDSLPEWAK